MKRLLPVLLALPLYGQQLTPNQFRQLGRACIPESPRDLITKITRTESSFDPYALSINYPVGAAKRRGLPSGRVFLAEQPHSANEAARWAHELMENGDTLSIGLMQVSTQGSQYSVEDLLDPCTNLRAGWALFLAKYQAALNRTNDTSRAIAMAISSYNTGSDSAGFANGYVRRVLLSPLD